MNFLYLDNKYIKEIENPLYFLIWNILEHSFLNHFLLQSLSKGS